MWIGSGLQSSLGCPFGSRSVPSDELGEYARQFLAAAIAQPNCLRLALESYSARPARADLKVAAVGQRLDNPHQMMLGNPVGSADFFRPHHPVPVRAHVNEHPQRVIRMEA